MCSLHCDFVMNVGFVLGETTYIVLCLNEQMTSYSIFVDGSSCYTLILASVAWVLYSPTGDLVSSGGTCLGPAMDNIVEYHTVIGLLSEALTNDVSQIRVYLDSKLFVQ